MLQRILQMSLVVGALVGGGCRDESALQGPVELTPQQEQEILRQLKPDPQLRLVKTVAGVGRILAPTIYLETGQIDRFELRQLTISLPLMSSGCIG